MLIVIKESKNNTQFCSLPKSLIVTLLALSTVSLNLSCSFPINFLFACSLQVSFWHCFDDCRPPELGKTTAEPLLQEEGQQKPEMFDNPLYGSMSSKAKVAPKKEQDYAKAVRKEQLPLPDQSFHLAKSQEPESSKSASKQPSPPFLVPTQRFRSYTCSSQSEEKNTGEKTQGKSKMTASSENSVPLKKIIKPSRSEVNPSLQGQQNKPPLPSKSRAVLDMQNSKGRDYRDSSELPHSEKHRTEEGPVGRTTTPVCYLWE